MEPKTLRNLYTWCVKIIIFAVPFLALFISNSMFFPYISGKNFAFRILIEIALVFWLGLIALDKEYRPKSSLLVYALLAFAGIVGLADIFGINPHNSFWSRFERMEGYIIILHLLLYFFMMISVMRKKRDWTILLNVFVIVGILVGGNGLLQMTISRSTLQAPASLQGLISFLGIRPTLQGGQRIDGGIGNPTYLAAFLMMLAFIALILLLQKKKKIARWFYGLTIAFFILIIFLSATRGAILGLALASIISPILYLIFEKRREPREKKFRKIASGLLVVMVVIPLGFFLLRNKPFIKNSYIFSRFANISLTEKTTRSRFQVWNISLQGFKERPILGWGQENYTNVFAQYYDPRLFDQEPWFDRSHNIVLDWLINAGLLGLLAYLNIFVAAFVMLWRFFKQSRVGIFEGIAIMAGLIAYFFQNLFVFDNFTSYITFFAILAYINNVRELPTAGAEIKKETHYKEFSTAASFGVFAGSIVLMSGVMVFANIRPIKASQSLIGILATVGQNSPDRVSEKFKTILADKTFGDTEILEQYIRLGIDLVSTNQIPPEAKVKYFKGVKDAIEAHLERFPHDIRVRMSTVTLYNRAAVIDNTLPGIARNHADILLREGPSRQQAYFASAENYLLLGQGELAIKDLEKAVSLEPKYIDARLNLALVGTNLGKGDIVQKALEGIDELINGNSLQTSRVADMYLRINKINLALELYKKAVAGDPGNADYHARLAAIYNQLGKKAEALVEAKKAAEIDPKTYQGIIEQIKK